MYTMKIYEEDGNKFKNPDDAIDYMVRTNFERSVHLYDIDSKKAYAKTEKIYEFIREYNKRKALDEQILPTQPYEYRGILGCLGVQAYEIGLGTYKRNHDLIVLFGRYKEDVLDTTIEDADIRPSLKALSSLSMIYGLI